MVYVSHQAKTGLQMARRRMLFKTRSMSLHMRIRMRTGCLLVIFPGSKCLTFLYNPMNSRHLKPSCGLLLLFLHSNLEKIHDTDFGYQNAMYLLFNGASVDYSWINTFWLWKKNHSPLVNALPHSISGLVTIERFLVYS